MLTKRADFGLWALGVATWIHLQTSKSSPAILWLSTRMRDSLPLKNRTALFQAPSNLCLFLKEKKKNKSLNFIDSFTNGRSASSVEPWSH